MSHVGKHYRCLLYLRASSYAVCTLLYQRASSYAVCCTYMLQVTLSFVPTLYVLAVLVSCLLQTARRARSNYIRKRLDLSRHSKFATAAATWNMDILCSRRRSSFPTFKFRIFCAPGAVPCSLQVGEVRWTTLFNSSGGA